MSSEEKSPDGPQKKNVDVNDLFCLEAVSEWGSTMEQRMEQAEWHFKEWQHENEETEKRLQNQIHELKSIIAVLRKNFSSSYSVLKQTGEYNKESIMERINPQIEKNTQNLENINLILQKLLSPSQLGGRKTRKRKTKKKRKKKRKRRKKRKTKRRR